MPLFIPQLMLCPSVPREEDKDMFRHLLFSAAATERVRQKEDSGLKEKSIQAISFCSPLDGQQALCLSEPILER
jgi:hypothetical protein